MLQRPIIKDEMDKKQADIVKGSVEWNGIACDEMIHAKSLMTAYSEDLNAVQQVFHARAHHPRLDRNMPPFSGALHWCR